MDILAWSGLHGKIGVDGVNWYEFGGGPDIYTFLPCHTNR